MKSSPSAAPAAATQDRRMPTGARDGQAGGRPGASLLRRLVSAVLNRYATLLLLGLLVVVFSLATPKFLTAQNWQNLLVTQSVVACLALAAILPLVAGEFDLSLGYLVGVLAMLGAYLAKHGGGAAEVIAAMIAAGLLVGLINGVLTVYFKISSRCCSPTSRRR
jgi:ribose/xylose/arabinose/galactoside ABC-type transport system permease subunit